MGFWLAVGKIAVNVGVPALTKFAQRRLENKTIKARREADQADNVVFWHNQRQREQKERRARAKAAR